MTDALQSLARLAREPDGSLSVDRFFHVFIGAMVLLVALLFQDFGVTWDEDLHSYYGELILHYYTSWFEDLTALGWWNLHFYGGAFDLPAAILTTLSAIGYYETRHAFNAAVGVLGIVGTWKLASALAGPRVGLIAAVALALVPPYFGHMFNNPKDVPFAVGTVWALYYMVRMLETLPAVPLSVAARFGVVLGLTTGVRVGGLLLLGYLGLLVGAFALWRGAATGSLRRLVADLGQGLLRAVIPAVAAGYPVLLLVWPYAQQAPIANPLTALRDFSHHAYGYQELFAGRYYWTDALPWTYLPVHLLIKLPELVVLMVATALVLAVRASLGRAFWTDPRRGLGFAMLGFSVLFPIVYVIAIGSTIFNGMRHFLFVVPSLCVIAAVAFDRLARWVADRRGGRIAAACLALYLGYHVSLMARLHPDQYVYYNALVGGVDGARGSFKLDYWGNSYAEAVRGLERTLRESYGEEFDARVFKIRICGPKVAAKYYFPGSFREAENDREADFVIALSNYAPQGVSLVELDECRQVLAGREIYRVERLDALLSLVVDRRALKVDRQFAARASRLHPEAAAGP